MFHRIRQWICPDLAIDLGSANTQVAVAGEGVVLDEPSVVALQRGTRQLLGRGSAVGKLAWQMLGRTPESITAARPIREGVIVDFDLCEAMLRYFMLKALRTSRMRVRPTVVVSVPGSVTSVERRAVFHTVERAGAGRVYLISEPVAAGIGSGLPISEPMASMVCDIGSGTTEVALFSLGETVSRESIRIAGDKFDEAIIDGLRKRLGMRIGQQTAELLKRDLGSAAPLDQELTAEVRGRDLISGIPRRATVTSEEIRDALQGPLDSISTCIQTCLENCSPDLIADLVDNGLVLTGGGSLLRNLDLYLNERLNIPVRVIDEPERAVVRGVSICLEHLPEWEHALDAGDDE